MTRFFTRLIRHTERNSSSDSSSMLLSSILRRRPTPATVARRLHLSSLLGRRAFRASAPALHGDFEMQDPASPEDIVRFVIVDRDARCHDVAGKVGDNLLYLCHRLRDEHAAGAKLALEGACEASLACSTCHVIISSKHYDLLDEAIEEEEDMLDEATCLTATSRLGCQIILSKKLDGMVVTLPAYSRKCACQPLCPRQACCRPGASPAAGYCCCAARVHERSATPCDPPGSSHCVPRSTPVLPPACRIPPSSYYVDGHVPEPH